jgi:hypothetical protein
MSRSPPGTEGFLSNAASLFDYAGLFLFVALVDSHYCLYVMHYDSSRSPRREFESVRLLSQSRVHL